MTTSTALCQRYQELLTVLDALDSCLMSLLSFSIPGRVSYRIFLWGGGKERRPTAVENRGDAGPPPEFFFV